MGCASRTQAPPRMAEAGASLSGISLESPWTRQALRSFALSLRNNFDVFIYVAGVGSSVASWAFLQVQRAGATSLVAEQGL